MLSKEITLCSLTGLPYSSKGRPILQIALLWIKFLLDFIFMLQGDCAVVRCFYSVCALVPASLMSEDGHIGCVPIEAEAGIAYH